MAGGGGCNKYEKCERGVKYFAVNPEKGRGLLEGLIIDGRIILKYILNRVDGVYWINLVQNGVQYRAFVNTLMDPLVP
jgi:hypothetical protein